MSGVRLLLFTLVAGLVLMAQSGGRITRDKFLKAVEIGGLAPDDFVNLIQQHGVDFQLNDDDRKALAGRGVSSRVIEAVTANLRAAPAPAPAVTRTPVPEAAEEQVDPPVRRRPVTESAGTQLEIVAGRPPQPQPAASAPPAGSEPRVPRAAAMKAVAVIVHKESPLTSIDASVLRRIYTGEQISWKNGRSIYVINRAATGVARRVFYKRILKADPNRAFYLQGMSMMFQPQTQEPGSSVRSYVSRMPDAIGYVDLSEVDNSVKVLAINGILPTEETLADKSYPLVID